jgi:hypothetical protein
VSDVLEGKVSRNRYVSIVNLGVQPGLVSIWPTPSPPGPYIQMARSRGSGRVRYRLQYRHTVRTCISTIITIWPSLMGLRGTQHTGTINYTLVNHYLGAVWPVKPANGPV